MSINAEIFKHYSCVSTYIEPLLFRGRGRGRGRGRCGGGS